MQRRLLLLDREVLTSIGGNLNGGSTKPELDVSETCTGSDVATCDTCGVSCEGTCYLMCATPVTCLTCVPSCLLTCQC